MEYGYLPETVTEMKKTARARGVIGSRASVVTRWTAKLGWDGMEILDFGSGKETRQTNLLREVGFQVTPHDFELNTDAVDGHEYDIIMVSNVLNIQPTRGSICDVLDVIYCCLKSGGYAIINYPKKPRRLESFTDRKLEIMLEGHFEYVQKLPEKTPLWRVQRL